jgi:hypothetical protein
LVIKELHQAHQIITPFVFRDPSGKSLNFIKMKDKIAQSYHIMQLYYLLEAVAYPANEAA